MINVVNKQNFSNHPNIEAMLSEAEALFDNIRNINQ